MYPAEFPRNVLSYTSSFSLFSSSSVQEADDQIGLNMEDKEVLKNIAVEFDSVVEQVDGVLDRYSADLDRIIQRNEPEATNQAFLQVAEHLFRKGITTLRIFVLLRFGYKLVQRFFLKVRKKMDQYLGTEVTNFILLVGTFLFKAFLKNHILCWVKGNGGWQSLLSSFNLGGLAICVGVFLIGFGLWKMSSSASHAPS